MVEGGAKGGGSDGKAAETEGTAAVLRRKGGEETAEKRDNAPAEVTNWEKAVALVMADFGEEMMAEEATS